MISVLFVVCVLAILACNLLTVILFYLDKREESTRHAPSS